MIAKEYKEQHGLDNKKGITSPEYHDKKRELVFQHYDTAIKENLLKSGQKTRFQKGDRGIGKYKRSQQTLERLRAHIKNISKKNTINI